MKTAHGTLLLAGSLQLLLPLELQARKADPDFLATGETGEFKAALFAGVGVLPGNKVSVPVIAFPIESCSINLMLERGNILEIIINHLKS